MTNEEADSILEARAVNDLEEVQTPVDYCPVCGKELDDGICPNCDYDDVDEQEEEAGDFCPDCGKTWVECDCGKTWGECDCETDE